MCALRSKDVGVNSGLWLCVMAMNGDGGDADTGEGYGAAAADQPGIMSRVSPIQEWIIMASIAGLAGVLFLIAIVLHKGAGKHPLMLITACTVGCSFITVVLWRYSTSQGQERRQIVLTITATLVAISYMILAGCISRFHLLSDSMRTRSYSLQCLH